ncbi:MAG: hypothetical protein HEP71_10055 [Roseivirga sp.]|nr:hypothetical protein [Roseivirga sp.]
MNGDRLKVLEKGFLEGTLTPEEETELKQLVADHKDHHLSAYFQWTGDTESIEVPDMRQRINLDNRPSAFRIQNLIKIAAVVLLLVAATWLLRPELFKTSPSNTYSQVEIDKSYQATLETLTAMADFLNESLPKAEECMNISAPFKELNTLENRETQEQ